MNKYIEKVMAPIHNAARSLANFLGGGKNTMIWGVRVYLWPFVMLPFVLLLAWGIDMLFFR